jgi:hypothetical protein
MPLQNNATKFMRYQSYLASVTLLPLSLYNPLLSFQYNVYNLLEKPSGPSEVIQMFEIKFTFPIIVSE